MEREQLLAMCHGWSKGDVLVIVYIYCFGWFCSSKGSRTLDFGIVNKRSCYCPGGYGGNIPYVYVYTHCHILVYGCFWSRATDITAVAIAKNLWCSVDTHVQDGLMSIKLSLDSIMVANTMFLAVCNLLPPRLPKIHNQQSLTLHCCLFSEICIACVAVRFDH